MDVVNSSEKLDKKQLNEYVGKRIKEERQKRKIKQNELAKKIGIQNSTLSQYENGKSEPNQEMLFKIAEALGINVSDLIPVNYRIEDNDLEKALKMARGFELEDISLLKDLMEKALSLKGVEREKFFDNIKFAIEYYDRNDKV
ncbi:helix-turn-helix transcriptional regulator [Solibacillus sp. FSL W7-1436]|uniref:helix-turn-helix domain-containing protein n=1 Tax=Solibacillus sp. FSL W7-1436 TaxID=2921705 RepID=UPI0030FBF69E